MGGATAVASPEAPASAAAVEQTKRKADSAASTPPLQTFVAVSGTKGRPNGGSGATDSPKETGFGMAAPGSGTGSAERATAAFKETVPPADKVGMDEDERCGREGAQVGVGSASPRKRYKVSDGGGLADVAGGPSAAGSVEAGKGQGDGNETTDGGASTRRQDAMDVDSSPSFQPKNNTSHATATSPAPRSETGPLAPTRSIKLDPPTGTAASPRGKGKLEWNRSPAALTDARSATNPGDSGIYDPSAGGRKLLDRAARLGVSVGAPAPSPTAGPKKRGRKPGSGAGRGGGRGAGVTGSGLTRGLSSSSAEMSGYSCKVTGTDGRVVEADAVVVTLPLGVLKAG